MAKWINCKQCGHEFSSAISRCPECGKWRLTAKTAFGSLLGTAFLSFVAVGMILGFTDDGNGNIATASGTNSNITSSDKTESNDEASAFESHSQSSSVDSSEESSSGKPESTPASSKISKPVSSADSSSSIPTTSTQSTPAVVSYPVGTIIKNNLVYTTVPKFYLSYVYTAFSVNTKMSFDEFAYSLKDEDKAYGYTEVIRNSNGDATLVLPWSKLNDVTVKKLTESVKYIHDFENQKFIKKIGHTEKFDKFEIILDTEELTDEQKASFIVFGVYFLEYQYTTRDGSDKCDIVLVYPDSSKETLSFPSIIK